MTDKYFSYCGDAGFETFKTAEEAEASAEEALECWSESAADNGWSDEARQVCWGELNEQLTIEPTGEKMEFEGETVDVYRGRLEKI